VCICPPAQVSTSQFNLLGRNTEHDNI
jgi:hypothetical protein